MAMMAAEPEAKKGAFFYPTYLGIINIHELGIPLGTNQYKEGVWTFFIYQWDYPLVMSK